MNFYLIFLIVFIFLLVLLIITTIYIGGFRYMYIEESNIYKLDKEYKKKKKIKNCIITCTTVPNRIDKIRATLCSILDSSVAVDEIRLNIPYYSSQGVKYHIPKWLKRLSSIKIYRTIKDWGPATKLIPTLLDKNNKNKKIIVVDDDVIYGYNTFETLNEYFDKYNKDDTVAITMYGDLFKETNTMTTRIINYVKGDNYTELLRGHSGYMVKRDMFTEKVFDYSKAPKETFFVDDHWFSHHLMKNKVKILQVGMKYNAVPLPDMLACNFDGLARQNNYDGHNERVVNRYFKN